MGETFGWSTGEPGSGEVPQADAGGGTEPAPVGAPDDIDATIPSIPAEAPGLPAPPRPRLHVWSVLSRTFDIFLAHPLVFIVLGTPSALLSLTALATSSDSRYNVLFYIANAVVVIFGLAIIVAADDARTGREVAVGTAFARATSRGIAGIMSVIVEGIVVLGLVAGVAIVAAILAGAGGSAYPVALVIVSGIGAAYVLIRWALAPAAIVIDRYGPMAGLNRSSAVTKGNRLRIIGLFLVIGLITVPFGLGVAALAAVLSQPVFIVLLGAAVVLLTTPLAGIATATAYGDLTSRPVVTPAVAPNPLGRRVLVGGVVVIGLVGLVLGAAGMSSAFDLYANGGISPADRGVILAGTGQGPAGSCQPLNPKTTFSTGEEIWIGGYFTKTLPAGQPATVTLYVNGTAADSGPLTSTEAANCYHSREGFTGVAPGTYRLQIVSNGETIGEGTFTVQ